MALLSEGKQALVFRRARDHRAPDFGQAFRSSGRALSRLVRKNALLLSVAGAVADETESESGQEVQFLPNDIVRLYHMGGEGPVPIDPEHESQGTLAWVGMLNSRRENPSSEVWQLVDRLRRGI